MTPHTALLELAPIGVASHAVEAWLWTVAARELELIPTLCSVMELVRVAAAAAGRTRWAESLAGLRAELDGTGSHEVQDIILRERFDLDDAPALAMMVEAIRSAFLGGHRLAWRIDADTLEVLLRAARAAIEWLEVDDAQAVALIASVPPTTWQPPIDRLAIEPHVALDREGWRVLHAVGASSTEVLAARDHDSSLESWWQTTRSAADLLRVLAADAPSRERWSDVVAALVRSNPVGAPAGARVIARLPELGDASAAVVRAATLGAMFELATLGGSVERGETVVPGVEHLAPELQRVALEGLVEARLAALELRAWPERVGRSGRIAILVSRLLGCGELAGVHVDALMARLIREAR
jgi:hypothetical protein